MKNQNNPLFYWNDIIPAIVAKLVISVLIAYFPPEFALMNCEKFYFSGHAVQRMFEKRISKSDVLEVISGGEIIADYPDDTPFPSSLILGFVEDRPIHVVSAVDPESQTCHIITAYRPDSILWSQDFRFRRK